MKKKADNLVTVPHSARCKNIRASATSMTILEVSIDDVERCKVMLDSWKAPTAQGIRTTHTLF